MVTFTLEKICPEDLEEVFDLIDLCFRDSPWRTAVYRPHLAHLTPPDELRAWRVSRLAKAFNDPHAQNWKLIAQDADLYTGKIVGFSSWIEPNHKLDFENHDKDAASKTTILEDAKPTVEGPPGEASLNDLPKCMDAEMYKSQRAGLERLRKEVMGEDTNFWYLASLVVHPSFQRKGLGQKLLNWGIGVADRAGLPIFLEASPEGKFLYDRNGFSNDAEICLIAGHVNAGMKRMPAVQA